MTNRRKGPEAEMDVEGHGSKHRADTKATPTNEPGTGPEQGRAHRTVDADVEGHSMLQNPMLTRNAVQNREREIQRNLRQNELRSEARRPFNKAGR